MEHLKTVQKPGIAHLTSIYINIVQLAPLTQIANSLSSSKMSSLFVEPLVIAKNSCRINHRSLT